MDIFSWKLLIDGVEFEQFGDISVASSLSGYGTSGVVTETMYVTTYDGSVSGNAISLNAEVELVCPEITGIPKFWVIGRTIEGSITKWTCADRMSKLEKAIDLEDSDFDENDQIECSRLISKICSECGFSGASYIGSGKNRLNSIGKIDNSSCNGSSARDILDTLSAAMCGYWCMGNSDSLVFVPFGSSYSTFRAQKYAEVVYGSHRQFCDVIMVDGDNVYTATGESSTGKLTLTIDTRYASSPLASLIYTDLSDGYEYRSWTCEKALGYSSWIYLGDILFDDISLSCNNLKLYPAPAGLFFSASCTEVSERENEYLSEIQRTINKKLELDKINNNIAVTKKGLYFFENGYKTTSSSKTKSSESTTRSKYGFEVSEGGVTEYDGAMVSKVVPSSAEWNDDKTEATVSYGEKKYKYTIERDESGNITNFAKEEVTE